MNILMFTHEKDLNGSSRSMLNLIDALTDKGVVFYVVIPFSEGEVVDALHERNITVLYHDNRRWIRKKSENPVKWAGAQLKWKFYNRYWNVIEAYKLKREIERFDIDLLHSNTSVICLGGILSRITGIPHIWHIREFGREGLGMEYLEGECETYQYIGEHADMVITISKALNDKVRRYIPDSRLRIIYNGVGAENVIEQRSWSTGEISFLISGGINSSKGQDVACKAVRELLHRGICNVRLYVAGRGDTEWLQPILDDCGEHIIFLGQISDMVSLRRTMDVELVCSKCEAFGRVTVEAMMGGMPVIGADTGGTPELISDGETGFLYEQGNYRMLADKMQYLLEHPEMIRLMGMHAQSKAIQKYSIRRCADEVYNVYTDVLNIGRVQTNHN